MEMEKTQVATLRNGKVTRLHNYEDRADAIEAVGLREWVTGIGDGSSANPAQLFGDFGFFNKCATWRSADVPVWVTPSPGAHG